MDNIPAVAYYRMSTDKQEDSIDRQRSQVEPYAKKRGYRIIRDYLDEGIAGDEEAKRKAFMQMLRDAETGQFSVILCDDKDRFGRFDSISYGYYVKPLRDAGVRLETIAQGVIDWSSFVGRITDAIIQEAKKIESQATSRRVITRMIMMAKEGKWLGGLPPYGYAVEPDPQLGKRLVPGESIKVEAVKLMFRLYAQSGCSLDQVVKELCDRHIRGPRGDFDWNKTTIRAMLGNQKYVGDTCWNVGHDGKYSQLEDGMVKTSDGRTPKRSNPIEDWIVVPGTHEPLIDRATFDKVQVRLKENRAKTSPASKARPYLLSGLLVCGRCGYRMIGWQNGDTRVFKCGKYHHMGKHGCYANMVTEIKVVRCIARKLQDVFLNPKNVKKLRDEVRRQDEASRRGDTVAPGRLKRQIDDLSRRIDQGIERMAMIDADLLDDFKIKVRGWKDEKARLEVELTQLSAPAKKTDIDAVLRAVETRLRAFEDAIQDGVPMLVREFLLEMVSKVEMHFDQLERPGRKTRSIFRQGMIFLRPQPDLAPLSESANLSNEANPTPAR